MRILIVDDYSDFSNILCEFLNSFSDIGIDVVGIACDGVEALEMIAEKRPDLIILDMIMPKLDGMGVLRELRSMELKKVPKIIVLSASDNQDLTSQAIKWGVDSYIVKPFSMDLILSIIKNLQRTPAI